MKFYSFFLCFFLNIVFAQGISVKDSVTNSAIRDVVVTSGANVKYISNKDGKIYPINFNLNDTLTFSHIAYSQKKIVLQNNTGVVYLIPKIIEQETVKIYGARSSQFNEPVKNYELNVLDKNNRLNLAEIINSQSHLHIRDYGGIAGPKLISYRGLSGENTIVLFNEARVNDIRTGTFDFSKISVSGIDKYEFYSTSDKQNSYTAPGGIIKLVSENLYNENKGDIRIKIGSDNYNSLAGNFKYSTSDLSLNLNFERSYGTNNYKYKFENSFYRRNNTFFNSTFFNNHLVYKTDKLILKYFVQYLHFKNGIPGYVVTNNFYSSIANISTDTYLQILNLNTQLNESDNLSVNIFYNIQKNLINDPYNDLFSPEKEKKSGLYEFGITPKIAALFGKLNIDAGFEFNNATIDGLNPVNKPGIPVQLSRLLVRPFLSLNYPVEINFLGFTNLAAGSLFNVDYIREKLTEPTSKYFFSQSFSILLNNKPGSIKINSNLFFNKRMPTIYEKYYANLIYPLDISAEKYRGIDLSLNLKPNNKFDFTFSVFSMWGEDKILWIPSRLGIHKPINIGKVKNSGLEISTSFNVISDLLKLSANYSYLDALNKSYGPTERSYNKQLPFTPKHKFTASFNLQISQFSFTILNHIESERYFTTDNSSRSKLNSFGVFDFSFTYQTTLFNNNHMLTLNIYNLFNEDYMIVQSYPMPLRSFYLTYKMEIL